MLQCRDCHISEQHLRPKKKGLVFFGCGAHGERIWEPSLSFSLKLRSYWPSLVMNSEAATSMPIFTLPV